MAVQAGMLQPDLIRHDRRLHMQRSRLQEPEALLVHSPFDFHGTAGEVFAFSQQTTEGHGLSGRQAWFADKVFWYELWRRDAVSAGVAMAFATGFDRAQEARLAEHNAIGHDLTLGNGGAKTPGRGNHHLPVSRLAQPAARNARGNKRLDQDAHRGVRR